MDLLAFTIRVFGGALAFHRAQTPYPPVFFDLSANARGNPVVASRCATDLTRPLLGRRVKVQRGGAVNHFTGRIRQHDTQSGVFSLAGFMAGKCQ